MKRKRHNPESWREKTPTLQEIRGQLISKHPSDYDFLRDSGVRGIEFDDSIRTVFKVLITSASGNGICGHSVRLASIGKGKAVHYLRDGVTKPTIKGSKLFCYFNLETARERASKIDPALGPMIFSCSVKGGIRYSRKPVAWGRDPTLMWLKGFGSAVAMGQTPQADVGTVLVDSLEIITRRF